MLAVAENGGRDPAPGLDRQGPRLGDLHRYRWLGRTGGADRPDRIGPGLQPRPGGPDVRVAPADHRRLRSRGGIAATFNAPLTGLFFGFEIVLREFSLDAILATLLSAVTADLVSRAFFGSAPFFAQIPHDLAVAHPLTYLLIAVLGVAAGLIGSDSRRCCTSRRTWWIGSGRGRPEWARPAVGGLGLGALLIALPQMYGVGYPVMDQMVAGQVVLWLLVVLMVGKVVATSLTLSIGGSGGCSLPSLFTGAAAGMAFGVIVEHLFGPGVGAPGGVRGGGHGRGLQRSRTGTADGDRQRRR